MLVAHALDLLRLRASGPEHEQSGLVESAEELVGRAWRTVGRGAHKAHEVGRKVAVVGAAAFVGPVDELDEAVGDLAAGAAPGVVALLREEVDVASGVAHARREVALRVGVALGVDDDDLPVAGRRNAVGDAVERHGLARARSAHHDRRALQA